MEQRRLVWEIYGLRLKISEAGIKTLGAPNVKDNGILSLHLVTPMSLVCIYADCMAKLWFVVTDASVHPTHGVVLSPLRGASKRDELHLLPSVWQELC